MTTVVKDPHPFPSTLLIAAVAIALIAIGCAPANELRHDLLRMSLTENLGGDTTRPLATSEAFTFVAANASDATRASFARGNEVFNRSWQPLGSVATESDGLGPIFNGVSCGDCHVNNGRGRAPASPEISPQSTLVRISVPGKTTKFDGPEPVPHYGTQIQDRAIGNVPREARVHFHWRESTGTFADGTRYQLRRPLIELSDLEFGPMPGETLFSARVANPLIGLGLLELIPDQTLTQLADPDDRDGDGISGRTNIIPDFVDGDSAVGRFGWKANIASLVGQNAAAARDDIGITNVMLPDENCTPAQVACNGAAIHDGVEMSAEALKLLTIYTRWIAVPRQRGATGADVVRGFEVFLTLGCGDCHIPTLVTGEDSGAPELSGQVIHPFTDLLLHDMGEDLADGRPDFLATGREWRTPPLWGIGLTAKVSGHTEFLHDGRARSVQEAILWHGGEAQRSRDEYRNSAVQQRALLLKFLNSL